MTRYALRFRDGTIQVRRFADDEEIARFQARGDRDIAVFVFSPDGRYLATDHRPGDALTVWDIDRQAIVLDDPDPLGGGAKFSPDSSRFAVVHQDGVVLINDLTTGQTIRRWHGPPVQRLAFRADWAQLATTHHELTKSTCRILESETGGLVRSITLPSMGEDVAWSPDGTTLATTCQDRKIYLWDAATGVRRATLEGHSSWGVWATFHPAGTLLASTGWEGRVWIWDAILGRPWLSLTGATESPGFSQDGRVVVRQEDKCTTYQVDPALEYRTFAHASSEPIRYHMSSIRRDGRVLAVATDRGMALWDLARGRELAFLPIGHVWQALFESSGDLLTYTGGSPGVQRWPVQLDPNRGEFHIGPPRQLPLPGGESIAEDRAGLILAGAHYDHAHVLTPARAFVVKPLDNCRFVAVSPDGKWLATGSHMQNGAQVWRMRDAEKVAQLAIEGSVLVEFSPDGKWLMTKAPPCQLWEVGTWHEARQIGGRGLCFSPWDRQLVVEDADKVLRLVETETGRTLARLESPDLCSVDFATFSPDGSRLVVTTNDGPAVHVWDLQAIGRQLKGMRLAWNLSEDSNPGENASPVPLRVEIATENRIQQAPSLTIDAPLKAVAPALDGRIGPDEYGPGYFVRFDDAANPGVLFAGTTARSKAPDDYSYRLRAAHTNSALYLAFEVRDQDVQVNPDASQAPFSDSIGLFIDGDHVPNDFDPINRSGNREGFQIAADADGHQFTLASDLTNSDWKVGTSRVDGGYVLEFEIPLTSIDTQDGPGTTPAKTGDTLRFNVGGSDKDAVGGRNIAILWAECSAVSPYSGGEGVWTVALRLLP